MAVADVYKPLSIGKLLRCCFCFFYFYIVAWAGELDDYFVEYKN